MLPLHHRAISLRSRIRTYNLSRPRRVNNRRYLPRNNSTGFKSKTFEIETSISRDSREPNFSVAVLCGSGRVRTYTLRRDLIYSQASQPIAQHFHLSEKQDSNLQPLAPKASKQPSLSSQNLLRQGWDSNSYKMDLQSIALTFQPPCLIFFCGKEGNRTLITKPWACLANRCNQPIFTSFPFQCVPRVWSKKKASRYGDASNEIDLCLHN